MAPFRVFLMQTSTLHHKVGINKHYYLHLVAKHNIFILVSWCLGPLSKTVTDFWRLVWQEKVRTIAMVTNIKEGKTKKCEKYWPEGGSGQRYGPFNLSLVEQLILADYTIRTIQLVVSLWNKLFSSICILLYYLCVNSYRYVNSLLN